MTAMPNSSSLHRFHTNVFARPAHTERGPEVAVGGRTVQTLSLAGRLLDARFPVSFEEAAEALEGLHRMDFEPDGFFVFSGEHEGARWQVNGHLFDFDERLHRVQLHGACPAEALDRLLRCFGWPETPVVFELEREGLLLDEATFRAWSKKKGHSTS